MCQGGVPVFLIYQPRKTEAIGIDNSISHNGLKPEEDSTSVVRLSLTSDESERFTVCRSSESLNSWIESLVSSLDFTDSILSDLGEARGAMPGFGSGALSGFPTSGGKNSTVMPVSSSWRVDLR